MLKHAHREKNANQITESEKNYQSIEHATDSRKKVRNLEEFS